MSDGRTKATKTQGWKRHPMRFLTVALMISSIVLEWVFLTGAPPQQALALSSAPARPTPVVYTRPSFETGIIFPRWGTWAYTASDPNYAIGMNEIQQQTGARWIELTISFHQATYNSTVVLPDPYSTTPASLAQGIAAAHAHGFKVFIEPLLSLDTPSPWPTLSVWSGMIAFPNGSPRQFQWFQGYWQALEPYLIAAQQAGAEQMAIGTEYQSLETAPASDWYWLIAQARSVYSGRLTYDINWSSLNLPVRAWMRSPSLAAVGVSMYISIARKHEYVPLNQIPERWAAMAGKPLDAFAAALGRPVFLSEIGYRNAADAFYRPFEYKTTADPDPQLQAALLRAALIYTMSDPHVEGIFIWAWSLPPFSPNWLPAAQTIKEWYHSPLA